MVTKDSERKPVYFRSLSLENVRCFGKKQRIDFLKKDGSVCFWNIIIGDNGIGKTTVLRSLVINSTSRWLDFIGSLFGFEYFRRNRSADTVLNCELGSIHSKNQEGVVIIRFEKIFRTNKETDSIGYISSDKSDREQTQTLTNFICFGYGASRRISISALSEEKSSFRSITLFDENAPLLNAEEWLVESDYRASKSENGHFAERKQKVIDILKKLFRGEVHDFKIDLEGKRPKAKFLTDYGWVNLHDLSLGYKTLIAWMTDFASRMFEEYPDSPDPLAEPAVVLVDEIDLHLHPQFQRELTSFLTETFPKTQFIVTAHSPLILQSAPDANINLLKK